MKYCYEIIFFFFLIVPTSFGQLTGTGKMYIPSGGGYFKVFVIIETVTNEEIIFEDDNEK